MTAASRRLLLRSGLLLLAGVAVAAPGAPSAALAGLPLTTPGLLCAAGVLYAGLALPLTAWHTARWLALGLAIAIGLKLVAAAGAPPLGLKASYWASAVPSGAVERSTDFPWLADATRIDARLDLRGDDFPVHFFNDAARFNFGPDAQPTRDQLPFSVRWRGWLLAPSDAERRFVVESTGSTQLWLDENQLSGRDVRVDVSAGLHALRVDYTRPEARVPFLRLSWERVPGGPLEVVGTPDVRWQASAAGAEVGAILGHVADSAVVAVIGVWIVVGLNRARSSGLARAALGSVPLLFLLHGVLLHAPLAGRATILSGLDDWLIYESSARDILLNGPLMDGGQGHAPPFYGQPLYPYALALAHRLTGESLFGPLALQFAALGGLLVSAAVLARRAFGSRTDGLAALAFLVVLLQLEPEHFKVARQLFNENLYMPLVMASLIVVVSLARRVRPPVWWQAALAGVLLGLTTISRSQFLLFVPLGLLILLIAWRTTSFAGAPPLAAIGAGLLITIAPVTARNWLVSGQLVPISNSGGASLLEFHRPPPGLIDRDALQTEPLFEALHLDTQTRTVLAFARADPPEYLATLVPPGAHSLGLQGRNDPGIYWPLFLTVVLYLASFGLRGTRRLHVWPIHAFVATHLLVLMLFEADTYGYRLVVPMYAPMAVVAAQVPLAVLGTRPKRLYLAKRIAAELLGACPRVRLGTPRRSGGERAWGFLASGALVWQAAGLVEVWPDRQPALHGLGGQAAHAATTAVRVGASAIYVASVDGTPRRFGAGSLPGLNYPWLKWFDPARSVPLPPPSNTAVYLVSELGGHSVPGDLVACLGQPDPDGEVVVSGDEARQRCAGELLADSALGVSFDGLARIDALRIPETTAAGESLEARLVWQPLVAHPEPQRVSLQLDDPAAGDGTLWGNGTLELYPAREWQPEEAVLSRLPLASDPTAIPQPYRVTLGIGPIRPGAPPAMATWHAAPTDRVPVSTVTLTPAASRVAQGLPADMRPVEGPPLVGGGLELIGVRPLPAEVAIGSPLRVGLLWRAVQDAPQATQITMRLVRDNGEVVQESVLPVLGGRVPPSTLHTGNVVRSEQTLLIRAPVPSESVAVEAELLDGQGAPLADPVVRLGSIKMTGRAHVFDASTAPEPEAVFGQAMQLLSHELQRGQDDRVTMRLRWRSAAQVQRAYKVFVHLLDPAGTQVVAQRDAEPQDGKAPTTSWVLGEVIDDEYAIPLPGGLAPGDYPIEIGVYDPRSGDRLSLANGDNRLLLNPPLHVP